MLLSPINLSLPPMPHRLRRVLTPAPPSPPQSLTHKYCLTATNTMKRLKKKKQKLKGTTTPLRTRKEEMKKGTQASKKSKGRKETKTKKPNWSLLSLPRAV